MSLSTTVKIRINLLRDMHFFGSEILKGFHFGTIGERKPDSFISVVS